MRGTLNDTQSSADVFYHRRRNLTSQFSALGSNLSSTVGNIDLSGTSSKLTKGFSELQQSMKESIGKTEEDAVTELPEGRFS